MGVDDYNTNIKEETETDQYFAYYGQLANQQNMLQDIVRTELYYKAIQSLPLSGKSVMDLGAGSGILSLFAAEAGAQRVHAVEASSAITYLQILTKHSQKSEIIKPIHKKVEDVSLNDLPGIEVLISEPIGVFLFHERMFESFLNARDRFNPQILMPCRADLYLAPFSDGALYQEVYSRVSEFWSKQDFFGQDMSCLLAIALTEAFSAPLVGSIDPNSLLTTKPVHKSFDFYSIREQELREFEFGIDLASEFTGIVHGFGSWFNAWLTPEIRIDTSPGKPRTHWHQLKLLLPKPIAINQGDRIKGWLKATVNNQRSYDLKLHLDLPLIMDSTWKLHDQQFWNIYPNDPPSFPPQFYNLYRNTN